MPAPLPALRRLLQPLAALALPLALASVAVAGDIRVMTSGAFAAPHLALVAPFEQATKNRVVTVTTSTGVGRDSIASRVGRGEAVDVIILPAAAMEDLIRGGFVVAESRVDLARSAIGMAVRAGVPRPDISTVEALTRTLLQAKSIAYSASVSGEYLSKELFPRLGLSETLAPKSRRIAGERVGAVVARGEAEIGFQQISELLEVKGVDLVGPLPSAVQRITLVAAGVAAKSTDPAAARAFIRFLASPEAVETIRKTGLEPLAPR